MISLNQWIWSYAFSSLIYLYRGLYWLILKYWVKFLSLWNKHHFVIVYNSFLYHGILSFNILFRIFVPIFMRHICSFLFLLILSLTFLYLEVPWSFFFISSIFILIFPMISLHILNKFLIYSPSSVADISGSLNFDWLSFWIWIPYSCFLCTSGIFLSDCWSLWVKFLSNWISLESAGLLCGK